MEKRLEIHLDNLIKRYPKLEVCRKEIANAYIILETAYSNGRKLLVSGNGGSASDSEHIVGELMKEFKLKRKVYQEQAEENIRGYQTLILASIALTWLVLLFFMLHTYRMILFQSLSSAKPGHLQTSLRSGWSKQL